jgi:hypothetical protein
MNFEMDCIEAMGHGKLYNIYIAINGRKLCIGQLEERAEEGIWLAYSSGNLLCAAAEPQEGALKLWEAYRIRHPAKAGRRALPSGECSVEERFYRVRRRVPRHADLAEAVIRQARSIPVERRHIFIQDVEDFIDDLEQQLSLWRKVREEAKKSPRFTVYR